MVEFLLCLSLSYSLIITFKYRIAKSDLDFAEYQWDNSKSCILCMNKIINKQKRQIKFLNKVINKQRKTECLLKHLNGSELPKDNTD